jgi:hypothetical protein
MCDARNLRPILDEFISTLDIYQQYKLLIILLENSIEELPAFFRRLTA